MSSHQGVIVYGELDMHEFHPCSAVRASDRIRPRQSLPHFLPGKACGFPCVLFEQPIDGLQEFSGGSVGEEAVVPDVSEVLVWYVGYEPFEKVLGRQCHLGHLPGIVVKVFEGYGIAVKSFYPGFADGRAFEVFAEIVDGLLPVRGLFVEMYDSVFFPEGVEKAVQRLFVCEVRNGFRKAQSSGAELVADEFHEGVLPKGFQDAVMEVDSVNPFPPVPGKTTRSGGEMDMVVPLEIPSESVDGEEYAREGIFLFRLPQDDFCGYGCEHAHQVTVRPDDGLKVARDGEGDVLPGRSGKPGVCVGDPLVCRLFPAGWAESGLAGVRGIDEHHAFRTEKPVEAKRPCPADKQLEHIDDDGRTHEMAFHEEELPPVAIPEENIPYFYCAA
jgi:hypothetical protein